MQLTRALAATSDPGVWTPADMPEWAVPAAFGILTIVYALIVFEIVHRALAAAIGGIAAVITLHAIGNGPDLGTVVTWIDEETIGLLIGMMVIVDILGKTGVFEWAAVQAYALSGGSIWRLSIILCTITAVFSAFLDNVTTILPRLNEISDEVLEAKVEKISVLSEEPFATPRLSLILTKGLLES